MYIHTNLNIKLFSLVALQNVLFTGNELMLRDNFIIPRVKSAHPNTDKKINISHGTNPRNHEKVSVFIGRS